MPGRRHGCSGFMGFGISRSSAIFQWDGKFPVSKHLLNIFRLVRGLDSSTALTILPDRPSGPGHFPVAMLPEADLSSSSVNGVNHVRPSPLVHRTIGRPGKSFLASWSCASALSVERAMASSCDDLVSVAPMIIVDVLKQFVEGVGFGLGN